MKKEFKNPAHGKGSNRRQEDFAIVQKNWGEINWKKWCAWCGKHGNHTSGGCKDLKKLTDLAAKNATSNR